MGNCGSSFNCTKCYSTVWWECQEKVRVDSDIAGIGILISFLASAFVTCLVIIWGYFTDSLPDHVLTETDKAIIIRCQKSAFATRFTPLVSRIWFRTESLLLRPFGRSESAVNRKPKPLSRAARVEALTRFVLALSDQQLVTGIAVVIAALASWCTINFIESRIVASYAWFSATTHLATLEVLRKYLYEHPTVRNWRVVGILVFMILFAFLYTVNSIIEATNTFVSNNANNALHCTLRKEFWEGPELYFSSAPSALFIRFASLIFLLIVYYLRIIGLYINPSSGKRGVDHEIVQRTLAVFILLPWKILLRMPQQDYLGLLRNLLDDSGGNGRLARLLRTLSTGTMSTYPKTYLSFLPQITFYLVFGVFGTIFRIWSVQGGTSETSTWGFGQVVPIALLALPVLVLAEVYEDAKSNASENVDEGIESDIKSTLPAEREFLSSNSCNRSDIICQPRYATSPNETATLARNHDNSTYPSEPATLRNDSSGSPNPQGSTNISSADDASKSANRKFRLIIFIFVIDMGLMSLSGYAMNFLSPRNNSERSLINGIPFAVSMILIRLSIHITYGRIIINAILMIPVILLARITGRTARHNRSIADNSSPLQNMAGTSGVVVRDASASICRAASPASVGEFTSPTRQDTEADIALVPLSQRHTF